MSPSEMGRKGKRVNIYVVDLSKLSDIELTFLSVMDSDPLLWHERLGHASLNQINKLVPNDLVIGLSNIKFKEEKVCEACAQGSRCGKRYVMVFIDDYSRFTWTLFLTSQDEAFDMITSFVRKTHKQLVTRNKARFVVQGYSQEECIDHDETFAPVAILEAIKLLITFAAYMEFTLYQMDVKSAFLNGYLKKEVFVKQLTVFENKEYPDHVYKLDKALYGFK
ncbi:uncharacterized protein [Nicotiana sylvestris]|uniref:uncharacterized protein n=1 Tax=Nicotiana sylvestris TaxID=4096 RepID=UPI00388CAD4D